MSLLLIGSGLFVSCKDSVDTTPQSQVVVKKPSSAFHCVVDCGPDLSPGAANPFDPFYSGTRNNGGGGLSPNAPLTAEQTAWINAAKSAMDEGGMTDFEKDMDKNPTLYLPILNQCQGQAYRDYFQTCQTAVDNYDNEKGNCLRNSGYPASLASLLSGQLTWKSFTSWLKGGNKGGNIRGFIVAIGVSNLVAVECIESRLTTARSQIADANREFSVKY